MARFKKVFKGYDIAEVDAFVAETEKSLQQLKATVEGKPIVNEVELSKREAELIRKESVIDATFKVLFRLIKNRLSDAEYQQFMLVADSIEKMSLKQTEVQHHAKPPKKSSVKNLSTKPAQEELQAAADNDNLTTKSAQIAPVLASKDETSEAIECTPTILNEQSIQIDKTKESNQSVETIETVKNIENIDIGEKALTTEPTDETLSTVVEEQPVEQILKNEDDTQNPIEGEPLIELDELNKTDKSLDELCKDMGFIK